jgi:protein arginine kinase activator
MLCHVCNKNVATVKYTEIVEGHVTEIQVCHECAQKEDKEINPHFGAPDFAKLGSQTLSMPMRVSDMDSICASCGRTYFELVHSAQLGCPHCYQTFSKSLIPLIERAHGATQHVGKTPKGWATGGDAAVAKLMRYRGLLQKAVRDERYEDAARLRDLIKDVESRSKS